jgi:hypothetical protein
VNGNESTCTQTATVVDVNTNEELAVAKADTDPAYSSPKNVLEADAGQTVHLWGDKANSQCTSYQWSWVRCPCSFEDQSNPGVSCTNGMHDDVSNCPPITPTSPSSKYATFVPPFGDSDAYKYYQANGEVVDKTNGPHISYVLELEVNNGGTTSVDRVGIKVKDEPPTAVLKADNDTEFGDGGGYSWRDEVSDCVYDADPSTPAIDGTPGSYDNCPGTQERPDYSADETVKTREPIFLSAASSSDDETPLSELKFYFVWNESPSGPLSAAERAALPRSPQKPAPRILDDTASIAPSELASDAEFLFEPVTEGLYACKDAASTGAWCCDSPSGTAGPWCSYSYDVPDSINAKAPYYRLKVVVVDEAGNGAPSPVPSGSDKYNWPQGGSNPPPLSAKNTASVIIRVDDTAIFQNFYWHSSL